VEGVRAKGRACGAGGGPPSPTRCGRPGDRGGVPRPLDGADRARAADLGRVRATSASRVQRDRLAGPEKRQEHLHRRDMAPRPLRTHARQGGDAGRDRLRLDRQPGVSGGRPATRRIRRSTSSGCGR
jgi:hypothetical protein